MTTRLTIYTRHQCHLCDEMKAVVARVTHGRDVIVDEIDVDRDPDLQRSYGELVPVLTMGNRRIAKYRVTEETLQRALDSTARRSTPSD